MEKVFEGQYNDEKILLRTRPNIGYYFLEKLPIFVPYILISILIPIVGFFLKSQFLFIYFIISVLILGVFFIYFIISVLILGVFFIYFKWMYNNAHYTITSRRCIFFVRKNIFKRSYKEIHLVDLRLSIPKKAGFFGAIFGYGTLKLIDKEEQEVIYHGINEHKYLARYLGRIIDYIKINGHTDNLSAYQPRKIREQLKQNKT